MLNVLILAGASKRGALEEQEKVENKSFININGQPMLKIVLDILKKVEAVGEIVIIGDAVSLEDFRDNKDDFRVIPQKETLLENLAAGLETLELHEPCIVMSADIPLITVESVNDLFERCKPHDMDLYYPIIERGLCEKAYPGVKRTYMRSKEGFFTGGNMMIVKPYWIIEKKEEMNVYFSYRKKPWKLVQTLSFKLIIKYILHTITLDEISAYLSGLFGVRAATVITPFPEIGVDVDKPEDIALVRELLSK